MVTLEKFQPEDLKEEACEHGYYTSCPHCRAKAEKPKLEVIDGGLEKKEAEEALEVGLFSEASSTHPERNEDASFATKEYFGVFDGMGGENAGNIASMIAAETIKIELDNISPETSLEDKISIMKQAFEAAHQAIIQNAKQNPEYQGMGTTATIAIRHEGPEGSKLIIGQIGDSRAYRIEDGQAKLETKDDSLVNYLVESGILNNDQDLEQKIPDQIKNNPQIIKTFKKPPETLADIRRGVTQALGKLEINPTITILDAKPGSRFIITSDGVHDHLSDSEIGLIGSKNKSPEDISRELVAGSKQVFADKENPRRKKDDDDKTAIVIDFANKEAEQVLSDLLKDLDALYGEEGETVELSEEDIEEMAG